jgi:RES domain-containing protein
LPDPVPWQAYHGPLWRIQWASLPDDAALSSAASEVGRFHHSGQSAHYTSLSLIGAGIAIGYYIQPSDDARVSVELQVSADRLVDLRNPATCVALGITLDGALQRWQPIHASGTRPSTWDVSDAARQAGAHGMLYPSTRAPDRTHLVLFDWNTSSGASLRRFGAPAAWQPSP